MAEKTGKELYTELNAILKDVDSKLEEAKKFATENKLTFSYCGATFVPKTDEVWSEWSDELLPVEKVEPSEEAGFYPRTDRGTMWVSSNCW